MSLKKTVAIVAAAGALAAISVPAMALENEFHGSYTFNGIFSNFQDGGSGDAPIYIPSKTTGLLPARDKIKTNNYFEQRGRIQYTAKVSDDLKLVTQFELDTRFGGITDGKYTNSSDAGVLDADGINLETKHIYLDFNLGSNVKVMTGIMPYKDTLKGIYIDADAPIVAAVTTLGSYTNITAFSRFGEDEQKGTITTRLGDRAADLVVFDNFFTINKDTKAALSYYFLADYRQGDQVAPLSSLFKGGQHDAYVHTLGASAETKLGPVALSGFLAAQAGHVEHGTAGNNSLYVHGWAANAAAKAAVGPGTLKTAFLFTSGNNNANDAQYRGWANSGVQSYNEGGMMILVRDTANSPTTTDRYLRRVITNVALLTAGYDANLTDKIYLNGNVGIAWAPASAGAPVYAGAGHNSGDILGTEFNLEAGYKVNANLTLRAQAAYAMLGGYYTGSAANSTAADVRDPENPYTLRMLASFKF